jgi:hypothetical protein
MKDNFLFLKSFEFAGPVVASFLGITVAVHVSSLVQQL